MASFLLAAAIFILAMVALGLFRVFCGPTDVDRMMAVQLLGTGGSRRVAPPCRGRRNTGHRRCRIDAGAARRIRRGDVRHQRVRFACCSRRCNGSPMRLALDIFTVLAVSGGAFFFLAGTVGLLRFPDTLTRLHALTKADNLGLGLVTLGLLPLVAWPLGALKLISVWLFVQLSGAIATQLIARLVRREDPQA